MRKVELRMNEQNKYEIIKKLVDTNGNKKRAATKLGCTVRTINRLIIKYKEQGKKGFMHGNRGRLPASTVPLDIKNKIISLYINDFSDANGSLTVVSNFSLTKSLKTLIISMLLSFFIVKFVKINVLIWANVCYNGHRR